MVNMHKNFGEARPSGFWDCERTDRQTDK